ncbi:hypothetical protein [Devosia sp. CAU 1758]
MENDSQQLTSSVAKARIAAGILAVATILAILALYLFRYRPSALVYDGTIDDVVSFYVGEILPDMVAAGLVATILIVFARMFLDPIDSLIKEAQGRRDEWSNTAIVATALTFHAARPGSELDFIYYYDGTGDRFVNPKVQDRLKVYLSETGVGAIDRYVARWTQIAKDANRFFDALDRGAKEIGQGSLNRIALDVEEGGAFFYAFNDDSKSAGTGDERHYMFAVTVSQRAMENGRAYAQIQNIYEELMQIRQSKSGA